MITIATITQAKLGLSAAERQELERLRQVVASIPKQLAEAVDKATKDAQKEIASLTADVMAIEKELTQVQGSVWGNKYAQYTYTQKDRDMYDSYDSTYNNSGWK